MATERRIERINRTLIKEIAGVIQREVKDPRMNSMISVLSAEISPDFRHVRVIVSIYGSNEVNNLKSLEALRAASGFIASHVGDALRFKHTPELHFESSDSIARGVDMYFKLKNLNPDADSQDADNNDQ